MPSREAMQDLVEAFMDQQEGPRAQPGHRRHLEERRAAFAPAGRLHPVPWRACW